MAGRDSEASAGVASATDELSPPSWWWTSIRSGALALALGAGLSIVVAVVCWLPDAGVSGRPLSAIRAGLLAFLDAHGGGIRLDGVDTRFVPLGLTVAVLVVAARAGRTLAAAVLDDSGQQVAGALALQTATYVVGCAVLVPVARLGTTSVAYLPTIVSATLIFAIGSGAAVVVGCGFHERLPEATSASVRAVIAVVAAYVGAGALLAAGSLIVHASRVMDLSRQVGGGLSGIPILVLGALCAPNAALAGSAYLAGPGFAVGTGTHVSAFATSHGLLPAFPILGALPDGHGANALTFALAAALVVVIAVVATRSLTGVSGLLTRLRCAGGVAVGAGMAQAVLAWRAGGAVGSGRLHTVGASPLRVGVAVALVVFAATLVGVAIAALWQRVRPTEDESPPAPSRALEPVG